MEEDIKYKKILNNRLDFLKCNYAITNEDLKAIKYLINRNKTLEKEIKLMKSINLEDNYIPKSKVREKIEEYEKLLDNEMLSIKLREHGFTDTSLKYLIYLVINNFKELIEEE